MRKKIGSLRESKCEASHFQTIDQGIAQAKTTGQKSPFPICCEEPFQSMEQGRGAEQQGALASF